MDEQMLMMSSEVVKWPSGMMILFKVLSNKFVNDSASQFQNFCVDAHCSLRNCQSYDKLPKVLHKTGSENAHRRTQNKGNGFGFNR
jgi:hypothetical protein